MFNLFEYLNEELNSPLLFFSKKIVWENRKLRDMGNDCFVSVDGVDFEITEPYPYERVWSKRWFTPKFKGPGVRYEVAICILTGEIVNATNFFSL